MTDIEAAATRSRIKRHHEKSRDGCIQCKRRKVKCDETQPVCGRCVKRSECCSLSNKRSEVSSARSTSTPSATVQFDLPREGIEKVSLSPSSIGVEDLEWIQTFLLETCPTLAFTELTLKTWQHYIPQTAFQNPFLLSALMAVAALHKASMLEDDRVARMQCCTAARRHQDAALTLFIPALSEAGTSSCVPLLCFNVLFSLLPFKWQALSLSHGVDAVTQGDWSPMLTNLLSIESMLDKFLQVTEVGRGTEVIIHQYFEWLQTSKVGFLLQYPNFAALPEIPPEATRSLYLISQSLEWANGATEKDVAQRNMYELQLQRLYKVCKCAGDEASRAHVLSWPTSLPREFVGYLQQRDSVAIAMVAFWAACFHALRDRWWARGWSRALVDEAVSLLGQEWKEVLQWPRQLVLDT